MRILAITHSYPRRSAPGAGIFIHRWHQGLRALGHDVQVLQLSEWAPPAPLVSLYRPWEESRRQRIDMLDEVDGIPVHHPRNFTPRPSRFFPGDAWLRESRTLARFAARHPRLATADVVLAHFMVPDGFHALAVGRALKRPVAAVAWGDDIHAWPSEQPYWRNRLEHVLRSVDLPIACSARLAADANDWLAAPRRDWQIVYGGVDLNAHVPVIDKSDVRHRAFSDYSDLLDPHTKILLTIARPVRAKGYIELLDAWQRLSCEAPGWQLVALGGHTGDLDVERLIAERDLTRSVRWLGYRSGTELSQLIMASDAFVLASHNEGLSLSLLEAMAAGLPAVATDVGGHRELITSQNEGWLVPARDSAALEHALRELLSSANRRAVVGRCARLAAERIGSPNENAVRLADSLNKVIGTYGSTPGGSETESYPSRARASSGTLFIG